METDERSLKRVCFLSEDSRAVSEVADRLAAKDVEVLRFSNVPTLTAGMGPVSDAVLVLDTRILSRGLNATRLVSEIERILGERTVLVCIAHSADIDLRLQALRAGAEAFFTAPVPVDELYACLLDLSGVRIGDNYRILVVDDQPVAAIFAARVLESVGMETRVVGEALKVLDVLEEFRPDLVLMDLHMPGADGIELTTLIRQHEELYGTPIVFLSSELDSGKQMQALRVGGDDFIAKPVRPERLIASVRSGIRFPRSVAARNAARSIRSGAQAGDGSEKGTKRTSRPGRVDGRSDLQLTEIIEEALTSDGLHLVHQPIMALQRLPGERYETILRLQNRDGELVSACDFLPAARRSGLMPALDRWVMEQALDELKLQLNAHRRLRFFVNQSMDTLSAQNWLLWFRDQIVARDLIMQRPVLQFQLQDLTSNLGMAVSRFRELRVLSIETCVNLSEEDSGGLELIEDLDIALVRLPAKIANSMETGQLSSYVEGVHALGSKLIVARIEQPQTIARAWSCGVDYIQGNFLQPPSKGLSFDFSESAMR